MDAKRETEYTTFNPYSFLEQNLKEYKETIFLLEAAHKTRVRLVSEYEENKTKFASLRPGSQARSNAVHRQNELAVAIQENKAYTALLSEKAAVLKAYPKFAFFIEAAKRRLSAEDWSSAWDEVDSKMGH